MVVEDWGMRIGECGLLTIATVLLFANGSLTANLSAISSQKPFSSLRNSLF